MRKVPSLRRYREEVPMTQEELSKASGVSRHTIMRLETGYTAYPSTIRKLAKALGVDPKDLMKPVEGAGVTEERS